MSGVIVTKDLSFSLNSVYVKNDFSQESNVERALNSAYRIISTPVGSDFENPLFGCKLKTFMFKLATDDVLDEIKEDIDSSLRMFEPLFYEFFDINVSWWNQTILGSKKFINIEISIAGVSGSVLSLLLNASTGSLVKK